ncbi:MAG: tetratricopeptide repeat protein [Blautia marasmi]
MPEKEGAAAAGGYCNILKGEYDKAEHLLLLSIQLFESPKMKRANYFNVAGAYDYLALIYRRRGEYEKAGKIMEKAICLCLEKRVIKSLDLFYEDYGYILYLQGSMRRQSGILRKVPGSTRNSVPIGSVRWGMLYVRDRPVQKRGGQSAGTFPYGRDIFTEGYDSGGT